MNDLRDFENFACFGATCSNASVCKFCNASAKRGRSIRLLRSGTFAVYAAPSIDIIAARRFDERRREIHLSRNGSAPWD